MASTAAAAMLKRTATLASRTFHSSSRTYVPVAPKAALAPASPNLSPNRPRTWDDNCFSTAHLGHIFKKNLCAGIDSWGVFKENGIATVSSFCRGPTPCLPQHASMALAFSKRGITTMGNAGGSGSQEASALPLDAPRLKFKRLDKTARHIMQILDKEAVEEVRARREIPDIQPGYIVQLKVEVPENKRRVSIIKGIVIARRNAGLHTTFRLRRLVAGVGIESLLPLYSPNIKEIKVLDKKKVRRAKLYYLRDKMNALKKH